MNFVNRKFDLYITNFSFSKLLVDFLLGSRKVEDELVYRSFLTPKPGPFGGSIKEVNPALGSEANLPLLVNRKNNDFKLIKY